MAYLILKIRGFSYPDPRISRLKKRLGSQDFRIPVSRAQVTVGLSLPPVSLLRMRENQQPIKCKLHSAKHGGNRLFGC